MAEVHRLLQLAGLRIARVDPASPDARWCVAQYFEELARRFESGFDPAASLAADDRELVRREAHSSSRRSTGGRSLRARSRRLSPGVGSLKRMWVAGTVRGLGIGRRMLEALEQQSRGIGLTTLRLETNGALQEAIHLYRSAGYREVPAFNADPYAQHWFEKRLGRSARRQPSCGDT